MYVKQNDFINYDIHLSLSVQMHESYMKNIFKHQIKVQVHGIHSKLYCILEVVSCHVHVSCVSRKVIKHLRLNLRVDSEVT